MTRERITSAPKAMRYQPKGLKLCFLTKFIKNLIATKETINATAEPSRRTRISVPPKTPPPIKNFSILKPLAPIITGTARKKVNSAAAGRATPTSKAPKIVAPEREVPGMREST